MKIILFCFLLFGFLPSPILAGGMSGMITNQITRTVNDGIAKNLFDNLIIPQLKIRNSSGEVKNIQLSNDMRFLSLLLEDGTARIWDLAIGVQRPMIKLEKGHINSILPSKKQSVLYVNTGKSIINYDYLTAKRLSPIHSQDDIIKSFIISGDDSTIITLHAKNKLSAWGAKTSKLKWISTIAEGNIQQMNIDKENKFLAISIRNASLFSSSDHLEIRSLESGTLLQTLHNNSKAIFFEFIQPQILESIYENGDITRWNTSTGKAISSTNIGHNILAVNKMTNGVTAYATSEDNVLVVNPQANTKHQISKTGIGNQIPLLLANGNKLMTPTSDGNITLWNVSDSSEVLQLITTKQGWTVIDNIGRFDSSEKGMPNISWEAEKQDIPIDSFSGKYYEPGLLATALTNQDYLNKKPTSIKAGITLPPKLDVIVSNIKNTGAYTELTVEVYGQGGGVEKVDLYHNAKITPNDGTIIENNTFQEDNKDRRTIKMQISPTNGKNTIKVTALNKMGIQGQSGEITFEAKVQSPAPILHVATIAINKYKDAQLNLDYSVADAQSISKVLDHKSFSKFSKVEKRQLYNSSATKLSIMSELINLSNGAQNDVLAIYAAGHGISVDGEWYFLPYETTLQPDIKYFTRVGISASELSAIFVGSKIQHILLMIDACYSGKSIDSFRRLQNAQRHFSRNISKSVGITIITATRKDQEAAELSELGHGLFTYVLAKGMDGQADWWPKNNQISAHELAEFSTKTIPEFSKRFLGAAQEPTAFTMGKDFPLLSTN